LNRIPEETRRAAFGDNATNETIWNDLNASQDQRDRVIRWLESLIVSELDGELEDMTKRLHTQIVREAYNTT
jgi:hypothetical protein